jgi:hypothetical protein
MPSVATMPKKSEDQYSEKEAAARFEAALKSAMNRPPPRRGTEGQLILFIEITAKYSNTTIKAPAMLR